MRSVLAIEPTSNHALASDSERSDAMVSLSRVLMGLSHPLQLISSAWETDLAYDWPKPPRIGRRWLAVITADDEDTLAWQTRTLRSSLEGVGFRCNESLVADSFIAPTAMNVRLDCVFDGTDYCASLVLRRWPREVAPGWLGQALSGDLPVKCAIHIQPQDAQRTARFLKKQQAWQDDSHSTRPDAGNALGRADAESVRLKLIAHTDKPVKVAVVMTVRAKTRAQLKQRVSTLRHEVGLVLGDVREATFEQDRGLEATEPNGVCRVLGAWHTLDCMSVASTGLFQPATISHANGADIGTTHDGAMLVKLDPFDPSLESFGGLIVAKTGMGKSYLLKLIARRLEGVQVYVVEQHDPPEYANVPGIHTLNLADIEDDDEARAERLRVFISDLWAAAQEDSRPRLLILDELYNLLRSRRLAALVAQLARRGRHHYLSLWISTQQVRELLKHPDALDNAAVRVYLKQHDNDLEKLCDAVGLSAPARRFLRAAARGQALLDVGGMLVPVDIQATTLEHEEISTDPRERRMLQHEVHGNALDSTTDNGGGIRDGAVPVGADAAGRHRRGRRPVAVANE